MGYGSVRLMLNRFLLATLALAVACSSDATTGTSVTNGSYDVTFAGSSNVSSKGYSPSMTSGTLESTGMIAGQPSFALTIKSEFKEGSTSLFLNVSATGTGSLEPGREIPCLMTFDESISGVALRRWMGGSAKIRYESLQNQSNTFSFTSVNLNPRGGEGNTAAGTLTVSGKLSFQGI